MLISNETSNALDILYGQFFNLNSLCDNAVSFMLNDWAMSNASNVIHHKLCHLFPIMADKISEIKDNYDERSIRKEVPEHKETYMDLKDMFDTIYNSFEDTYKMIKMTYKYIIDNNDVNVQADFLDFVKDFNKVIGQIITLKNKAEQMPTNFDTFDRHIDMWGINGLGD